MTASEQDRERLRPADAARLLAGFDAPWWIAGGWALDLFLDTETRQHGDLDVAVLRADQLALYRLLHDWDLRYATVEHALAPWNGRALRLPIHELWARRSHDASREGVPFLQPEVVLLYKSTNPTVADENDFAAVEPWLSKPARSWLRHALRTSGPEHPWLHRLARR